MGRENRGCRMTLRSCRGNSRKTAVSFSYINWRTPGITFISFSLLGLASPIPRKNNELVAGRRPTANQFAIPLPYRIGNVG
jgi:hypothetical protein